MGPEFGNAGSSLNERDDQVLKGIGLVSGHYPCRTRRPGYNAADREAHALHQRHVSPIESYSQKLVTA
jgi:hypothetical protein